MKNGIKYNFIIGKAMYFVKLKKQNSNHHVTLIQIEQTHTCIFYLFILFTHIKVLAILLIKIDV